MTGKVKQATSSLNTSKKYFQTHFDYEKVRNLALLKHNVPIIGPPMRIYLTKSL